MVRLHFSHVEMTLSLFAELAAHKLPEMCVGGREPQNPPLRSG
jgi:hypothetical protein